VTDFAMQDAMVFGALISETDTVTIISLFSSLKVEKNLFANVFGESVFNDAVALVLYRTAVKFLTEDFTPTTLLGASFDLVFVFTGSLGIGIVFGLISAIVSKYVISSKNSTLQICLILVISYASYLFADGLQFSGIATILACGIIMAHYTYNNLTPKAQKLSKNVLRVISNFSEMFVFVYLGIALVCFDTTFRQSFDIGLIALSIPITFLSRCFNIFPLTYLVNLTRSEKHKIKFNDQILMWYGGLRGCMAFALSLETPSINAKEIFITTTIIVLFSILVLGGLTIPIIKCLEIKIGKEADVAAKNEHLEQRMHSNTNKFIIFDRKYVKPFLTHYDRKLKEQEKENRLRETEQTEAQPQQTEHTETQTQV